jgi:hypothetical protein
MIIRVVKQDATLNCQCEPHIISPFYYEADTVEINLDELAKFASKEIAYGGIVYSNELPVLVNRFVASKMEEKR